MALFLLMNSQGPELISSEEIFSFNSYILGNKFGVLPFSKWAIFKLPASISLSFLPFQSSTSVELLCICCLYFSSLDYLFDPLWSPLCLHLSREDTPLKTTNDWLSREWHQLPAIIPTALISNEVMYLKEPVNHQSIIYRGWYYYPSKWSIKFPLWLSCCNSLLIELPESQSYSAPRYPILMLQSSS